MSFNKINASKPNISDILGFVLLALGGVFGNRKLNIPSKIEAIDAR